MTYIQKHKLPLLLSALSTLTFMGCNNNLMGQSQGQASLDSFSIPQSYQPLGDTCSSKDPQDFCIGLKYVVYKDSDGNPLIDKQSSIKNTKKMNQIWSQCHIAFQIDEYLPADPNQYGLKFNTTDDSELDQIRKTFNDNSHFLVVTTGSWDRTGSLGNTAANAWTSVPGDNSYGVVLESPVGTFSNIIAHELGHYMNLFHVDDTTDLMNPIIYNDSTQLTQDQCDTARSAINQFWTAMLR